MRAVPNNPLGQALNLYSRKGPKPTPRTMQLLRRHDLADMVTDSRPEELLAEVQKIADQDVSSSHVYAVAELAYIAGRKIEGERESALAMDMYAAAVANAYFYLLNSNFDMTRNPYDPQFRRACDLYNKALESMLRIIQRQGQLHPGRRHRVKTGRQEFDFTIAVRGPWHPDQFAEFKFVSDFEVDGLTNHYFTYGLGVPLIAVYKGRDSSETFYPPGMSFPVTAFLRVLPDQSHSLPDGRLHHNCVLELYDTLAASDVRIEDRLVPLETNLTTPLAYCLDNPIFRDANLATRALIRGDKFAKYQGLYTLEPYDPNKIPVLMVHGFWSSLITWMEMFNDLRGSPEIRDHFQFWFYLYPTGQPFWVTASQLRTSLAQARDILDPHWQSAPMDHMVMVGHSMGGLICKLQTLDSGQEFWRLACDRPFEQLDLSPENRDRLARLTFFKPNRSIRQVVMIATPHRGSRISNSATRWLSRRIINLPNRITKNKEALLTENPRLFGPDSLLHIDTSVESLDPESPILPVILRASTSPWVSYHNIIGVLDKKSGLLGRMANGSDGVVSFQSAHLDNVDSEITVAADHLNIHRSPRTVMEVQRILRQHLNDVRRQYPTWTGSTRAHVRIADGTAGHRFHDASGAAIR